MIPTLSDLADCTIAAWVMEHQQWRFVFDSSDGEWVVQHELQGVSQWQMSELRNGICVMEVRLKSTLEGAVAYTIETVCNETIEVICDDVVETVIKHRADRR